MAAAKNKPGAPAPSTASLPAVERPINQAKVLELIHKSVPGSEKAQTLQDGVTFMLSELNRLNIKITDLEKNPGSAKPGSDKDPVLAAVLRVEQSIKQLKDQQSTMRQYGVGAGGAR